MCVCVCVLQMSGACLYANGLQLWQCTALYELTSLATYLVLVHILGCHSFVAQPELCLIKKIATCNNSHKKQCSVFFIVTNELF